jgi:hypothetical protein
VLGGEKALTNCEGLANKRLGTGVVSTSLRDPRELFQHIGDERVMSSKRALSNFERGKQERFRFVDETDPPE